MANWDCPWSLFGLLTVLREPSDLGADALQVNTHAIQDPSRHTFALPHDADEQVLGVNVVVTQAPCLIHRQLDHFLGLVRKAYFTRC